MHDLIDENPYNKNARQVQRADFGSRISAYILDVIFSIAMIIFVVLMLIGFDTNALWQFLENIEDPQTQIAALPFMLNIAWAGIAFNILYASLEAFTGASLGKRLVGLKIGTQDAQTAETGTYILRGLLKNLNIPLSILALLTKFSGFSSLSDSFGLFFLVSCLFALGADRLALHDKMVGTAVYKKIDLDKPA